MVVITPDRHSGGRGFESSSGHKKVFLPMKVSFRSCPSLAPSWLAGWSLYVQSCFIRGVKVQINFCHMVENCFVVVRLASSCFVFWIQNILATLRIVLQLGQNYSCRWVESNFVAGFIFSHEIGLNASRDWKIGEYGWAIFANFQISRIAKLYNYSCFEEGCLTKGEKLTRQCQEPMGNGLLAM